MAKKKSIRENRKEKIAIRDVLGEKIIELKNRYDNILVLDADLASSTRMTDFREKFDESFIEVGVAEQNMIGMAAGLATMNFIPFVSTFACFSAKRALDQIRVTISQPNLNVKIIGAYTGLFTGKTGKTHQTVQDLSIMRSMPNMRVVVPGDGIEMSEVLNAVVKYEGPVYMRIARPEVPLFLPDDYEFKWGEPYLIDHGKDVTIFSTGIFTSKAIRVREILQEKGIDCGVVHVPSIKPLNEESIIEIGRSTEKIVTLENHNILGGLGSRMTEIFSRYLPKKIMRIGIDDVYSESAPNDDLLAKHCLRDQDVVQKCLKLIKDKK